MQNPIEIEFFQPSRKKSRIFYYLSLCSLLRESYNDMFLFYCFVIYENKQTDKWIIDIIV